MNKTLFAAAAFTISACGGSTSPKSADASVDKPADTFSDVVVAGDSAPSSSDGPQGIQDMAAAICGKMRDCIPGRLALLYASYDECVTRISLAYAWTTALPGVTATSAQWEACAVAWSQASCSGLMGFDPDACWWAGTRPSGAACNDGSQCTSMFCRHQPLSCGVCETMPDIGATCAESVDCGRGTSCTPDGTCQVPRVLGEACSLSALPCRDDFACVQGKCVALPASVGAACDWQNGQGCDIARSYSCDTVTGRCLAVAWADAGEYCGYTAAGATKCVREGICATDTCVPVLADHASCDVNLGPPCEWPARCSTDTKTCLLPNDATRCP